jgi:hypothetical protein
VLFVKKSLKRETQEYQIPIDEGRFHINRLSEREKQWAWQTYCRVVRKQKKLASFVEREILPLRYTKAENQALLTEITLAFAMRSRSRSLQAARKSWTVC